MRFYKILGDFKNICKVLPSPKKYDGFNGIILVGLGFELQASCLQSRFSIT
jgi:hypothetical protein